MPPVVRHLSGPRALVSCAEGFDALSAATGSPVTARRLWLQTWIDCYPQWTPWVPVVEHDGAMRAAAPLARRRIGGLLVVRGIGFGRTDDVRLPALTAADAQLLASSIAAALDGRGPWRLEVEQLPEGDPVAFGLAERLPSADVHPGDGSPSVQVTVRDPQHYLSRNTRKALAKIDNKLAQAGLGPEATWTRDAAEVRALLPELAAVHRARDEAMGRRSDHSDPRAAQFYREVISRHADAGAVDLLTVRLRGELAAYVCGFADGVTLRVWDNRLSPSWTEFSVGRIANTEALRHVVISERYDELDWMRGEEPYKLQSATRVVSTATLRAWSSFTVKAVDALVARARDLKRTSPTLHRGWSTLTGLREQTLARRAP